jgi:site-specific DNA-methyltransferase (adenine-specific)
METSTRTKEEKKEIDVNVIVCSDNVEYIKNMPENSVDCVVTSPPYDGLRSYEGFSLDLRAVGKELFRVMKPGAIAAVVIQDSTVDGRKTLTSMRMILNWCDEIGFGLFENCIYSRQGVEGAWWTKRFRVDHEYIPMFIKGKRPLYFDKSPLKIPSKHGGKTIMGAAVRRKDGLQEKSRPVKINTLKCRGTIWNYPECGDGSKLKHQHPATFPNLLPYDVIECFCPTGGIVLDPFNGSGTTCVAAKCLGRKYIGIDIAEKYCEIARQRVLAERIDRKIAKSEYVSQPPTRQADIEVLDFSK